MLGISTTEPNPGRRMGQAGFEACLVHRMSCRRMRAKTLSGSYVSINPEAWPVVLGPAICAILVGAMIASMFLTGFRCTVSRALADYLGKHNSHSAAHRALAEGSRRSLPGDH
jgi:hypothetical protein